MSWKIQKIKNVFAVTAMARMSTLAHQTFLVTLHGEWFNVGVNSSRNKWIGFFEIIFLFLFAIKCVHSLITHNCVLKRKQNNENFSKIATSYQLNYPAVYMCIYRIICGINNSSIQLTITTITELALAVIMVVLCAILTKCISTQRPYYHILLMTMWHIFSKFYMMPYVVLIPVATNYL